MVSIPLAPRRPLRGKGGGVFTATGVGVAATIGIVAVALVCGFSGMSLFWMFTFRPARALMPAPMATTAAAPVAVGSAANLRRIGLAMHQYHSMYDAFPPAAEPGAETDAETDGEEKLAHSWRVYLLPFLGRQDLYDRYDFDQPWDSAANKRIRYQMPDVFANPNDYGRMPATSSYSVVTGKGALFDPDASATLSDCKDGTSKTIFVVEVENPQDNWLKPGGLDIDTMVEGVNTSSGGEGIASPDDAGGAYVLMVDGTTRRLTNDMPPEKIRSMILVDDDGDDAGDDADDDGGADDGGDGG